MARNVIWIDFNRIKIFVSEDINIRGIQLKGNDIWGDSITIKSDLLTEPTIERKKDDIIYIGNLNEDIMNITKNKMTVICEFSNTSLTEIINDDINETIVVDINGNDITNKFAFNTYIEPLGIYYHLINKTIITTRSGGIEIIHQVNASNISGFNSNFGKNVNENLKNDNILNLFLILGKVKSDVPTVSAGDISKLNSNFGKIL